MTRPILTAALIAYLVAPAPSAAEVDVGVEMIILDTPDDDIDGAGFAETLEAYVSDLGVGVTMERPDSVPADHDAWVELAKHRGAQAGVLAVMWFEPTDGAEEAYDVYLVLMERQSESVIIVPVELGVRRGPEVFRVLAATARMVIDTELLDDLRAVAAVSREELRRLGSVPAPPRKEPPAVAAPAIEEPPGGAPEREPERAAAYSLTLGYLGDLGFGGPRVLNGVRVAGERWFRDGILVHLDLAYIGSSSQRTADLVFHEERIPLRVGVGTAWELGKTRLAAFAFWALEILWADTDVSDRTVEAPATAVNPDTGGGLEARWSIPLWKSFAFFAAASVQAMAVSHRYTRDGVGVIDPSYARLAWSAGLELHWRERSGRISRRR